MPDYKLEIIMRDGPWLLDNIGLVSDRRDNDFYELSTGHMATEIEVFERDMLFFGPIEFEKEESVDKYLSYLFLRGVDPNNGDADIEQRAADREMAMHLNRPCIWSTAGNEFTIISHNDQEIQVPTTIWIHELIPLPNSIETVIDLRNTLKDITGNEVFGINLPS